MDSRTVSRMADHMKAALLDHLSTGQPARIPAGGDLLWQWFNDLNSQRRSGMTGPDPIQYSEIIAYGHLTGWGIGARHIAILRAMDAAYLDHIYSKNRPRADGIGMSPQISKRALSPGLFDAMIG